jgi:hypothetical protein
MSVVSPLYQYLKEAIDLIEKANDLNEEIYLLLQRIHLSFKNMSSTEVVDWKIGNHRIKADEFEDLFNCGIFKKWIQQLKGGTKARNNNINCALVRKMLLTATSSTPHLHAMIKNTALTSFRYLVPRINAICRTVFNCEISRCEQEALSSWVCEGINPLGHILSFMNNIATSDHSKSNSPARTLNGA